MVRVLGQNNTLVEIIEVHGWLLGVSGLAGFNTNRVAAITQALIGSAPRDLSLIARAIVEADFGAGRRRSANRRFLLLQSALC